MVTGHGKINSYLYRFKISETPLCSCGNQDQTTDKLLFECDLLQTEQENLLTTIRKTDVWPTSKSDLIKKYFRAFIKFTNAIVIDKLTTKLKGDS